MKKYMCFCGKNVEKLISYFKNGIRITCCSSCAEQNGLVKDSDESMDYDVAKKNKSLSTIDTREKIK